MSSRQFAKLSVCQAMMTTMMMLMMMMMMPIQPHLPPNG
jgi:hypothetical protein